jgi:hypothetical protein
MSGRAEAGTSGDGRVALGWGALAAFGACLMLWARSWPVTINDFGTEASAALVALIHGHLSRFAQLAPAYGGSLELRAPAALIASLGGGGGELAIYRASALPCLLAAAGLAGWLIARARTRGAGIIACVCLVGICAANPITYEALRYGHPEELLGGVLCVAAVLCASRDRPVSAGLLLGLAVANKEWALVAAGPVFVALPSRRLCSASVAAATATVLLLPMMLGAPDAVANAPGLLATQTGDVFHPFQVWWFLGHPVRGLAASAGLGSNGARTVPGWLDGRAHMLIVAVALPLTLLYRRRAPAALRSTTSPLLLLALLLLLRCVLDPWDAVYYPLPFILALVSWESLSRHRPPFLSIAATAATWVLFVVLPRDVGLGVQAIACLGLALPAVAALAVALYGHRAPDRVLSPGDSDARPATHSLLRGASPTC